MLIHIILDDKFIDMALREFEIVAPGGNTAILVGKSQPLHFVKSSTVQFMSTAQIKQLAKSGNYKAIIFHSLPDTFLPILSSIPKEKTTIWLGWGHDYYDRLLSLAYPDGLLLPQTAELKKSLQRKEYLPSMLRKLQTSIRVLTGKTKCFHHNLLEHISYFCPVIEPEYKMASHFNSSFTPKYLSWNYGTAEDDFLSTNNGGITPGNEILVGNSASFENNHLEVFDLLANNFDIGDRKIITPLSYGDKRYAEKVQERGQQIFGSNFVPLVDFIPKEQYITLLNSCGFVFMNHLRQQALGNICIMMLNGAQIFLHQKNPLYQWFSGREAIINNLSQETSGKIQPLEALTYAQRQENTQVIMDFWGRSTQRKKTQNLVSIALGKA